MKKATYVFLLLLIVVNFCRLAPFGRIISVNTTYFITILFMVIGYFMYSRKKRIYVSSKYNRSVYYLWASVFVASLLCMAYQGQSLLQSFITCRGMYIFSAIPLLLIIQPTEKDIIKALVLFACFYAVLVIIEFFGGFQITVLRENLSQKIYQADLGISKYNGIMYDGIQLLTIPMFYYACSYHNSLTKKDLVIALLIYFLVFLAQNRSTYVPATILMAYVLLTAKSRFRYIYIIIIIISIAYTFTHFLNDSYNQIIEQTSYELDNPDYARNLAWYYFLDEGQHSTVTRILGNGMKSNGITNDDISASDVGFISVYYYYGIVPIIIYFYYLFSVLFIKRIPTYLKMISLLILCGVFTTSWFMANSSHTWFFMLFIYLYIFNKEKMELKIIKQ